VANHPSALKRQRQAEKRRLRNRNVKTALRTYVRGVREAVAARDSTLAKEKLAVAARALDRAVTKGVLHARSASRKISRLARLVNSVAASK
jgi:small subunit ribosomal protein S20